MEVLLYQITIAIIIFIACRISTKTGIIVSIFCVLFSIVMIYTSPLMILQLFTIVISFILFKKKNYKKKTIISSQTEFQRKWGDYKSKFDASGKYDGKTSEEIKSLKKKEQKEADLKTINNILKGIGFILILILLYCLFLFILGHF